MSQEHYVVLLREPGKRWASSYGLFKSKQDARDYVENNLKNTQYKVLIAEASDEEIDKALQIKGMSNRYVLGIELLSIREV